MHYTLDRMHASYDKLHAERLELYLLVLGNREVLIAQGYRFNMV